MPQFVLVLSTFPTQERALAVAQQLVRRRLAACVNLIPGVISVFEWQGSIEQSSEVLLLLKTDAARYPELAAALAELHPYEVPEIVGINLDDVDAAYARWLASSLSVGDGPV